MKSFDLILFDCDGVLVDSELIACGVTVRCLALVGIDISLAETIDRYVGVSLATMTKDLRDRFGDRVPPGFSAIVQQTLREAFRRELRPMEGVKDALQELLLKTCVASSGDLERIRLALGLTGLLRFFNGNLFSATQVPRGKPAPDLFLFAATQMSAEPGRSVVIEDSALGIAAAVLAGMCPLGFYGGSHCGTRDAQRLIDAGARVVFQKMAELPKIISTL